MELRVKRKHIHVLQTNKNIPSQQMYLLFKREKVDTIFFSFSRYVSQFDVSLAVLKHENVCYRVKVCLYVFVS